MDSFIFKGKSSEEFKIIVNSLPSISKPTLRVEEIEIDGVDGTRYEDLGYGSYDKKIKITITEDNIDSLIGWLKGEGDLILSNEPDKYYKAKIIDQVNFSRLMKYEPTEISFRVQPFKYEYQEEEQTIATGSIEGTEIKINDVKATEIKINGKSTQDGIPTPDSPVEIESAGYENLYKIPKTETKNGITLTNNGNGTFNITGTATANTTLYMAIPLKESKIDSGIYTISCKSEGYTAQVDLYGTSWLATPLYRAHSEDKLNATATINITSDVTTVRCIIYIPSGKTINLINETIQLEKGSVAHPIIPYGKYGVEVKTIGENILNNTKYELGGYGDYGNKFYAEDNYRFSEPVEVKGGETLYFSKRLCVYYDIAGSDTTNNLTKVVPQNATKIYVRCFANDFSTFKPEDYMISRTPITELKSYKKNASVIVLNEPLRSLPNGVKDIAYLRNNKLYVDKYIGSTVLDGNEEWGSTSTNRFYSSIIANLTKGSSDVLSNYFVNTNGWVEKDGIFIGSYGAIGIINTKVDTVEAFKTWLSTHNVQVNYELITPVTEELGDLTMLDLVDGENNISNSADTNMVVDYVDNKLIINNTGNYISKPTFEIEGAGTIKFILNGYSVFSYNFDEDGRVVIDSEKEDAYLGSVLKNRNMNGDFPKLELGENVITWEGLVKSMKVVKKSRWL